VPDINTVKLCRFPPAEGNLTKRRRGREEHRQHHQLRLVGNLDKPMPQVFRSHERDGLPDEPHRVPVSGLEVVKNDAIVVRDELVR
jgi:hypothetical protein